MNEIEKELTFLLRTLPSDIDSWEHEFLADTYIPESSDNPQIRLRQRGDKYYITKKYPLNPNDLSTMVEETIHLSKQEYSYLCTMVKGKRLAKTRYFKKVNDCTIEIDQYLENLNPLLVLDIEWKSTPPNRTLINKFDISREITQTANLAAGQIAGKKYAEILKHLQ